MQEIIINIMNNFGYLGIALLVAIENIFPPIPSEVILTFGGFMTTYLISIPAGMTKMKFNPFILLTTLGSAILNSILVYLGVIAGASWETVVAYVDGYSKIVLISIIVALLIGVVLFYKKKSSKIKKLEIMQNMEDLE